MHRLPRTPRSILAAVVAVALAAGCAQTPAEEPDAGDGERVEPALVLVAGGLDAPVAIASAGDGSARLFVVERGGRVRAVEDGVIAEPPYLDVSALLAPPRGENGLLGLAFHPAFPDDDRIFVRYVDDASHDVVASLRAPAGGAPSVDVDTLEVLLRAEPAGTIHHGGDVAFGPDGYLYASFGDGSDPSTAQDLGTLHGSIVRLDVDAAALQYGVPAGNPFVGVAGARPEIWAYGLRNPWRFSFDAVTGDLWIADVGQNEVEEVNLEPAGGAGGRNYGWPIMEGDRPYAPPGAYEHDELTLPLITYGHDAGWGRSVIGGIVYRGDALTGFGGTYVFGDFVSGTILVARDAGSGWQVEPLLETPHAITSFGVDGSGEIHLVDLAGGGLYRLVPAPEAE